MSPTAGSPAATLATTNDKCRSREMRRSALAAFPTDSGGRQCKSWPSDKDETANAEEVSIKTKRWPEPTARTTPIRFSVGADAAAAVAGVATVCLAAGEEQETTKASGKTSVETIGMTDRWTSREGE